MARVPALVRADLAAEDQDLLERDINLFRVLSNSPKGARAFLGLARHIRHVGRLDPRLRELAIIQVGFLAGSPYEYSHHVKIGLDAGVTPADIERLAAESRGTATDLEPAARAVLRAAREMTVGQRISDSTFDELRSHFDAERLVDLVMVIGFYNGVVRILASLEVDVEDEYLPYLDETFLRRGAAAASE